MKIKEPPKLIDAPFQVVYTEYTDDIEKYMALARATLADGRWLHFDELVRRWPKYVNFPLAWSLVKSMRTSESSPLLQIGGSEKISTFKLTSSTQRAISLTDQKTTHAQLTSMLEKIGENNRPPNYSHYRTKKINNHLQKFPTFATSQANSFQS